MIWYVLLGFFTAVGVLFTLWLILGAFLPARCPYVVAVRCPRGKEKALLRRYRWLKELGLLRCPIILVGSRCAPEEQAEITNHFPGVRFQTPKQWLQETEERLGEHG